MVWHRRGSSVPRAGRGAYGICHHARKLELNVTVKPSPELSELINATHLAVISGAPDPKNPTLLDLARAEIFGTAFPISPSLGLFGTAHHVYRDAAEYASSKIDGRVAVGRIMTKTQQIVFVEDKDEHSTIDFALLKCPGLKTPKLAFDFRPLNYLDEVFACGFPFAITLVQAETYAYYLRSFAGHVVTRRGLTELPATPPGYETTFVPPPGLSGAPLLSAGSHLAIRGMVLKEHVAELAHAPERKMNLGIALDTEELLTIDSGLVGGSLAQKIFEREKVDRGERTP